MAKVDFDISVLDSVIEAIKIYESDTNADEIEGRLNHTEAPIKWKKLNILEQEFNDCDIDDKVINGQMLCHVQLTKEQLDMTIRAIIDNMNYLMKSDWKSQPWDKDEYNRLAKAFPIFMNARTNS